MSTDYTSLDGVAVKAVPTFESTQTQILQGMLQNAYDFGGHKPEKVHVYFQIGEGVAGAGFLFEVDGKVLEVNQMLSEDVDLGYEATSEHQQQLMNVMSEQLLQFISHCVTNKKPLPSEVWTSAVIDPVELSTSAGYGFKRALPVVQEAVTAWKKDLEDPSYLVMKSVALLAPVPF